MTMLPARERARLLKWFDRHHRPLPFRESRDPYRIWVSEVMLQQTTVTAVVPYFERFILRFTTVSHLANASEVEVLKLWEGLGYYRRAKHLHAAAKRLAQDHGDHLPNDPAYWLALPGVGRYIQGAVLSQAFDRRLPIVEANTLRVLSRLFGYTADPRSTAGQRWLWQTAESILPHKRIGDFNQAMMELGALICKPDEPRCDQCPLKKTCVAKRDGLTATIPMRAKAIPLTPTKFVVLIMRNGSKLWLGQRPEGVRWAGMWELPNGEIRDGESIGQAAIRVGQEMFGIDVIVGEEFPAVRQTVTRYDITYRPVSAIVSGKILRSTVHTTGRWVASTKWNDLPMPVAMRQIIMKPRDSTASRARRSPS
jgi:A/G-specific adenine glycosylase